MAGNSAGNKANGTHAFLGMVLFLWSMSGASEPRTVSPIMIAASAGEAVAERATPKQNPAVACILPSILRSPFSIEQVLNYGGSLFRGSSRWSASMAFYTRHTASF